MDVVVTPGAVLEGSVSVPGDKSIAHRWLILAAAAAGRSRLVGLPPSLDVRSTAVCLAAITDKARPSLDVFARNASPGVERRGSTWNEDLRESFDLPLEVEGQGRPGLVPPAEALDCGNFAQKRTQAVNVRAVIEDILGHGNTPGTMLPGQLEHEAFLRSEKAGGLLFTDAEIAEFDKLAKEGRVRFSPKTLKPA